ncbi:MAG: TIGR04283 family arsenosugar biosynthesis glycosyltransferase [Planctomycetota bacterium]
MTGLDVSVVIPTINEESGIAAAIESAISAGAREVIVSDGGSTDQTLHEATAAGASKIVKSIPGRGIQLNSGAFVAEAGWLLFLHADNRLTSDCLRQLERAVSEGAVWGAFRQQIQTERWILKTIQWGNAQRVKWRKLPFGDQAICAQRKLFKQQGGFAEIPLMEDVEFSKRMRKIDRPVLLDGPILVDPRRWDEKGPLRQTLLNWSIQLRYLWGESPESLRKRYQ